MRHDRREYRLLVFVEIVEMKLTMFLLTMFLWLGGVLEGLGRGLGTREVVMHVASVTGVRLASFAVMGVIVMMSAVGS